MEIQLELETTRGRSPLSFTCNRMVNAGYTGRNQAEVRRHIQELAAKGIQGPPTTPTLYPVVLSALTTAHGVEVYGDKSSGEVEYVLLVTNSDEIYVGLGSDHTDRFLEEVDIPRAKQICPNVLSRIVWPLQEMMSHWDDVVMTSTVTLKGKPRRYQEGRLGLLMSPLDLMKFVEGKLGRPPADMVIFSGTMGTLDGEFLYGERFAATLQDNRLQRRLSIDYQVNLLDYLVVD